jgi:GT2 family glycosyltransferase
MSVGLVVPTLGERLDLLDEAIRTIESQEGVDVLVVVVTTNERLSLLTGLFPGCLVVAQPGSGIVDAISAGWACLPPDTTYVAWLGDDDRLTSGSLAAASAALDADDRVVMAFGRCLYVNADGHPFREVRPGRIALTMLGLGYNLIAQPGALYRRRALEEIGGLDPQLRLAFDVDLHRRLAQRGKVAYLPRRLGHARVHGGSLTTSQREASTLECRTVLRRELPAVVRRTRSVWQPAAHLALRVAYKLSSRQLA